MTSNFPTVTRGRCAFVAICLGLSLAALSGCVGKVAETGESAVTYVSGELEANLGSDYNQVVAATRGALAELDFVRLSENQAAEKAVLASLTPLEKKVEVTVLNSGNKLTNIKIRVGIFGDEQVATVLLDKIKARL